MKILDQETVHPWHRTTLFALLVLIVTLSPSFTDAQGVSTWAALEITGTAPLARLSSGAIYDPLGDRMVMYGGYLNLGDTWQLTFLPNPVWTDVEGPSPGSRQGHRVIYDRRRQRMVLFGGISSEHNYLNDVWELSLDGDPRWNRLTTSGGGPAPRVDCSMIYDAGRDRILVFGGYGTSGYDDLWALSLSGTPTWERLYPAGTPPSALWSGSAIYDPARDRMVVFGGAGETEPGSNKTWELMLAGTPTWAQITTVEPSPVGRTGHSAIYDPLGDRMVVFGGASSGAAPLLNDTWALSLSEHPVWTVLHPGGTPPSRREQHVAVYDSTRHRMLVFGGPSNEIWELTLPSETHVITASAGAHGSITPSGMVRVAHGSGVCFTFTPDPHCHVSAVSVDGMRQCGGDFYPDCRLIGGYCFGSVTADHTIGVGFALDSYVLSLTTVGGGLVTKTPDIPSYEYGASVQLEANVSAGWEFAGWSGDASGTGSVISVVMDRDKTITATFALQIAFDFKPHDLHLDSKGRWVTGYLRPPAPYRASQIDVPSIRLNGAVAVSTEHPAKLEDHDTKLKVKFLRAEVKPTLAPGDHVPVTITGTIEGLPFTGTDFIKVKALKIHTPKAGDILAAGTATNVTWDFPDAPAPTVTLLSSFDDGVTWNIEAQSIANTGSYTWTVPATAYGQCRLAVIQIYDTDETGVVPESEFAESDAFSIMAPTGVESDKTTFALRPANPVVGPLTVSFSLASEATAMLAVYDVSGRAVISREVNSTGRGWHTMRLGDLPAGVYVVRLSQAGRSLSSRVAVVR